MAGQRFTVAIILATLGLSGYGFADEPTSHEFVSAHMGTMFRIKAFGERRQVEKAATAAFARIAELDQIFSDYKPDSEIMKLCKANDKEPNVFRPVPADVNTILRTANALSQKSEGAFDVTVGPLVQLWRIARRTQVLPVTKEMADAQAKVGYEKITISKEGNQVKLAVPGMRLDFGGIVKGYAVDEALAVLENHGIKQALIAASGDIRVGDPPPGKKGWNVEIAPLEQGKEPRKLILANAAVSTSGDLFQFVEIDGVRYSHVLDPKTGLGLTGYRSVTVVAKTGIEADSLTKACSVMPFEKAKKLIESIDGAAVFLAVKEKDDSPVRAIRTDNFTRYERKTTRTPNIVFILADDLGINDLSSYGRKDQSTPHLDRLASQGMRFTSAYCAQPICSPSRLAIMTGKHPARLHLTTYLPGRPDAPSQKLLNPVIRQQLPLEEKTVAEYLKDAGYTTACIGKWHLGGANFGPAKQGFDVVYAGTANTKPGETEGGKGEYDLTRKACDFLAANKDKPFFLYLPHNTPHIPLAAKPELIAKYKDSFNPVYAACIHSMDETVGTILAKLDELKLADNTLVIFQSDNGGLHVPEGKDDAPTHNTPYRAGKGYLYEGGLRVPTIVRWPGVVSAGKVSDVPFVNTDWTPTILDTLGIEPQEKLDGRSILPLLQNKPLAEQRLFWHFPHYNNQGGRPGGAIREGDWKLVLHYDDGKPELFNLKTDVGETTNLADKEPDRVAKLSVSMALERAVLSVQNNRPNPDFNAAQSKAIYVDYDSSKLKPTGNAKQTSDAWRDWRKRMNEAVAKKK
jgi:arylsulfatase A